MIGGLRSFMPPPLDYESLGITASSSFGGTWSTISATLGGSTMSSISSLGIFASPGVFPYDLSPGSTLYAGDSNVHILGVDHTEDPRADYAVEYNNLLSLGKPFGISEGSDGD